MSASSHPDESSITIIHVSRPGHTQYTLEAAASLSGVDPDVLKEYCQAGLLGRHLKNLEGELRFDDNALYEIGWIEYYRTHHGVNREALTLIFDLRRDLQRLQDEVRFLRGL